jgi:KUP system potassium uptake protein
MEPATTGAGAAERHPAAADRPGLLALSLGAVGVVYGDIGTSPLYALREALHHAAADGLDRAEVLGVVSLLLWALIIIVTIKYVLFLTRLDNRGEGGTLSLLALFQGALGRRTPLALGLAVAGTALFYADAAITPAISVLSAVEGLKLVTPVFEPYVVPITLVVLGALFTVQRRGTASMGRWFGPITAVWFLTMAVAGLVHIGDDPGILAAFDPRYALAFVGGHGMVGFVVLGSVFLAVTGAEALYADMGHFGAGRSSSRG